MCRDTQMKSAIGLWLVGLSMALPNLGCCTVRMNGACGTSACGPSSCGAGCDLGGCGEAACGLPFSNIRHRIAGRIRSTNCASGCGEIYWDEQINEPPVCDPCGCDGQFTGDSCGSCPNALWRLRQLWGYRFQPSSCDTCSSGAISHGVGGGCSTCGTGDSTAMHHVQDGMSTYGSPAHSSVKISTPKPMNGSTDERAQPTPATRPIREESQRSSNLDFDELPMQAPGSSRRPLAPQSQATIGSGVSIDSPARGNQARSVQAKPVSTKTPSKNRLVTNPGR
jgi:hypothetical protein